jgi:ATP-dependent DNA helicase RecQ
MERDAIREEAGKVLTALAGRDARLRPDQWTAIEALVVDRRRVLCVQRTGWGKSAVYFVATAPHTAQRRGGIDTTATIPPTSSLLHGDDNAAPDPGPL